jgi:cyclopropane-fatty-acyl-phospholipid synthase
VSSTSEWTESTQTGRSQIGNTQIESNRGPDRSAGPGPASGPNLRLARPDRSVPQRLAPDRSDSVARALEPLVEMIFQGQPPVRLRFWDRSEMGATDAAATVDVRSPDALRRLLWSPGELGLARAYVSGDLEVIGDLPTALEILGDAGRRNRRPAAQIILRGLLSAVRLGVAGPPLPAPAVEARRSGRRHSRRRDAEAIGHHYDVGNDFYRLLLGPSMVYSCARFTDAATSLEAAQEAKMDMVCRKLGLDARPGTRLLDVGCGWGSLAIHAARRYGVEVVGITLSREQAGLARERVAQSGLDQRVEIRVQDYRDLRGERFDAISSVGMSEHVGGPRLGEYFETLRSALAPGGRLLNHAISRVGGSAMGPGSFIGRYIFPDGELIDVGDVVLAMERHGLEVRDIESLREHYPRTLQAWLANLEGSWTDAVAEIGLPRARAWRLYMAASANAFAAGKISVHQVLAVAADPDGTSHMPATRSAWV